jgi:hypothetical protein
MPRAIKHDAKPAPPAREQEGERADMDDLRKSIRVWLGCLAALAVMSAGPALAKDVALTQGNVSRFLASFSQMRMIALGEGLKAGADADAARNPFGAVIKAIKSSKLQTEAKTIAARHGFADLKEWLDTGKAIGQAYVYVKTGPGRGVARETVDKNKERAIRELEKYGLVNEKQKEKLKEHLDDLGDQLAKEPSRENVAVVQQMKPDIEAVVKLGVN